MRDGFDLGAAALFYLVYGVGLVSFVVLPAPRVLDAMARGALFGLVAYATYDLTNQATLRDWPGARDAGGPGMRCIRHGCELRRRASSGATDARQLKRYKLGPAANHGRAILPSKRSGAST